MTIPEIGREELPELIRHAGKQDWITAGLPIHQPATHLES